MKAIKANESKQVAGRTPEITWVITEGQLVRLNEGRPDGFAIPCAAAPDVYEILKDLFTRADELNLPVETRMAMQAYFVKVGK